MRTTRQKHKALAKTQEARSARRAKRVWCVQSKFGWCATTDQSGKPDGGSMVAFPVMCGHFVYLPFGVAKQEPTCKECREKSNGGKQR